MTDRLIKHKIERNPNRVVYSRYKDNSRGKYFLLSYRGKTFVVRNLLKWCRERGLKSPTLYNTLYNPNYTHRGYKLLSKDYWVSDERVLHNE